LVSIGLIAGKPLHAAEKPALDCCYRKAPAMIPFICPKCGQFSIDTADCSCDTSTRETSSPSRDAVQR
jgi:hypothetical protein